MTAPLDPATLRALAVDLDEERAVELHHSTHCGCGNPFLHIVRIGLLDDLAARYRTSALKVELAAKETR